MVIILTKGNIQYVIQFFKLFHDLINAMVLFNKQVHSAFTAVTYLAAEDPFQIEPPPGEKSGYMRHHTRMVLDS